MPRMTPERESEIRKGNANSSLGFFAIATAELLAEVTTQRDEIRALQQDVAQERDSREYWRGVCERQQVAGKELTEQVERLSADLSAALAKVAEWEKDKEYILKANAANEWEDRFQIQENRIKELLAYRAALLELLGNSLGACVLLRQTWRDYVHPTGSTVTLNGLECLIKEIEVVTAARAVIEQVSK